PLSFPSSPSVTATTTPRGEHGTQSRGDSAQSRTPLSFHGGPMASPRAGDGALGSMPAARSSSAVSDGGGAMPMDTGSSMRAQGDGSRASQGRNGGGSPLGPRWRMGGLIRMLTLGHRGGFR
ncbi:unnamed protein product, partial [Discosporangium mesarthrocarpum]